MYSQDKLHMKNNILTSFIVDYFSYIIFTGVVNAAGSG